MSSLALSTLPWPELTSAKAVKYLLQESQAKNHGKLNALSDISFKNRQLSSCLRVNTIIIFYQQLGIFLPTVWYL